LPLYGAGVSLGPLREVPGPRGPGRAPDPRPGNRGAPARGVDVKPLPARGLEMAKMPKKGHFSEKEPKMAILGKKAEKRGF